MDCHHHIDQDKIHLHNGHNIRRICQDYILLLPIVLVDNSHSVYPITFKQSDDKCGSAADHAIKYNWTNQKGDWTKQGEHNWSQQGRIGCKSLLG